MADWTAVERCRKPSGYGKRHLLALLGFCGFALSYAMRFSLSIAIVAMVNNTALGALRLESSPGSLAHHKSLMQRGSPIIFKSDVCPHDDTPHKIVDLNLNLFHVQTIVVNSHRSKGEQNNNTVKNSESLSLPHLLLNSSQAFQAPHPVAEGDDESHQQEPIPEAHVSHVEEAEVAPTLKNDDGEFPWSEANQGVILGSFFWGYVCTQIFGGWISQRIGGKLPFGLGLLITALFAIATPSAARLGGMNLLIFVRIVQGLAGGVTVPAMQAIISKWFPPEERGKLGSFALAGMPFGTFLSTLCSGFLIHSYGWPSVFYVTGVLTLFWFILWTYLVYASPIEDPKIDQAELRFIQESLSSSQRNAKGNLNQAGEKLQVPWSNVLLSAPFWAILLCNTCETWGLYTINAELPSYMKTVLHFDIKQNSVMSAFPHLLTLVFSVILTNVGDRLIEHKYFSIGTVRKLSTSIAMWGYGAALLGVAYSGCDRVKTVTLLALAIGCNGGKFGGFLININDIAPNYAGILMGIINTIASMPGFFAPWIAGLILNENPSLENWRLVFLITAGIAFVGNLIFLLFASGNVQAWNEGKNTAPFSMGPFNQVGLPERAEKAQQHQHQPNNPVALGRLYVIPLNQEGNEPAPGIRPPVVNPNFLQEQDDEGRQHQQAQLQQVDGNRNGLRCSA